MDMTLHKSRSSKPDLLTDMQIAIEYGFENREHYEALLDRAFKEIECLREDVKILNALRAAGVDNWMGWDDAMDLLHSEDEDE